MSIPAASLAHLVTSLAWIVEPLSRCDPTSEGYASLIIPGSFGYPSALLRLDQEPTVPIEPGIMTMGKFHHRCACCGDPPRRGCYLSTCRRAMRVGSVWI